MATFEPPPTYAEVVLEDENGKHPRFNPIWLKWFVDLAAFISASGGGGGGGVSHNSTTGLQGGTANQYYHITQAQDTLVDALGTISSQNSNNVMITGGAISGTSGAFTTLTAATIFRPPTDAAAAQTVTAIYAGNGAPNDANGANGDFYFRGNGSAGTFIYHKAAGTWAAFV